MKNIVTAHLTRLRMMVFLVSLLFVVSASLVAASISVEAGFMMPARQQTAAAAAAQTAPAEKTVEQVQKNIQVLTGLPQSQLIPVMNYMGSSLGVKCTFCHVRNGEKWDFVSDDKPEKASAREMIKMVQGINKGNFKGNPAVGCITCHRGSAHPVRVPQLPMAEPTPFADAETASAAPNATPPTTDQILAKYIEALGGAAAIEKLKTRVMKGTWQRRSGTPAFDMPMGYEVYQAAPDKLYTVLNTPKQGVFETGFDGQIAWQKSQRGLSDLSTDEVATLKRVTGVFRDPNLQRQFTRISFAGKDKIDGKDVYVLPAIGVDGKGERLYFDVQTGLLVRRITSTRTVVGLIPEQVDYEDYRDVDGLKVPFTIRITSIDSFNSSTRKFAEIRFNVPVDETKFKKPPAPAPIASPSP